MKFRPIVVTVWRKHMMLVIIGRESKNKAIFSSER